MRRLAVVITVAALIAACSRREERPDAAASPSTGALRWDPQKTYAVIAGVLSWKDRSLASFSPVERKDKELHDLLAARGVPAANRVLLLDEAATASAVLGAIGRLSAKAERGSTMIVYYAGHGMKTNDGHTVFASTDVDTSKLESTGLHVDAITPLFKSRVPGGRVIFLADCCYSGGLTGVAKDVAAGGLETLALTSAASSNTSTGNWTFTQTIIDGLKGRSLADHDQDGTVTLGELAAETKAAMKSREGQLFGFASYGVSSALVLANAEKCPGCKRPELDRPLALGSYVLAPRAKGRAPARVVGVDEGKLSIAFYDYSHETLATALPSTVAPLDFKTYPVGSELDVTWGGKVFEAKVLKVEDGFHYITYPGWATTWDEWVTSARINGPRTEGTAASKVKVEWHEQWWDAVVLRQDGARVCVHYIGWADSWDECVTKDRVKPAK